MQVCEVKFGGGWNCFTWHQYRLYTGTKSSRKVLDKCTVNLKNVEISSNKSNEMKMKKVINL